jgi:hypothetical protein
VPAPALVAQAASNGVSAGQVIIWIVVAALLLGLYRLNRASRRKADAEYWRRRARQEELKRSDPDMAPPSDEDDPG